MRRAYILFSTLSVIAFGSCFGSLLLSTAFPAAEELFSILIGLSVFGLMAFLFMAMLTGAGVLLGNFNGRNRGLEKQKRDFQIIEPIETDDQRMQRIMSRLSAEEREYLREVLAAKRMGLANDGEIVSMDDLLQRYDDDR